MCAHISFSSFSISHVLSLALDMTMSVLSVSCLCVTVKLKEYDTRAVVHDLQLHVSVYFGRRRSSRASALARRGGPRAHAFRHVQFFLKKTHKIHERPPPRDSLSMGPTHKLPVEFNVFKRVKMNGPLLGSPARPRGGTSASFPSASRSASRAQIAGA